MFILKKGHQPGVYVPLRALFLVHPVLNLILMVGPSKFGALRNSVQCLYLVISRVV